MGVCGLGRGLVCLFFVYFVVNTKLERSGEIEPAKYARHLDRKNRHRYCRTRLDKTTTKAIVTGTGINEAYIYRCFSDKEDLLSKTFDMLDNELLTQSLQHLPVMYMQEMDFETRSRLYFASVWNFLLGNREKCLAYIRYYYSPYFKKFSVKEHKARFTPFIEKFKLAFIGEADVWMILCHILNVMLAFAAMVHTDQMSKEDNYSEHVFRVVYQSIKQYLR